MKYLLALLALLLFPTTIHAATLTWIDPSPTDHTGFAIERESVPCTAPDAFTDLATVADVRTYIDSTTQLGYQYCYRLRAFNTQYLDGSGIKQYSAYSNKAGIDYPLPIPVAPGQVQVTATP